jgi:hypothetical protein
MIDLNFPKYPFRFKIRENNTLVFDIVRRKYVILQPEEWVRQHCLHFLMNEKGYPAGRMLVEKKIKVNGLYRRIDLGICNSFGKVDILIECKSPDIQLTQSVFDQIARYNLELKAEYLMVTNGLQHVYCKMDYTARAYVYIPELPSNPDI